MEKNGVSLGHQPRLTRPPGCSRAAEAGRSDRRGRGHATGPNRRREILEGGHRLRPADAAVSHRLPVHERTARHQILPQVERFPMSRVNDAIDHLRSGKARYRVVLDADF